MDENQADLGEAKLSEAFRHHGAGDIAAARQSCRELLARAPDHPQALHLLGVIRYQEGDTADALALLERAATLDPGRPAVLRDRGIALLAAGHVEAAAESFRAALALEPGDAEAAFSLGVAERRRGRLEAALPLLRAAAAAFPDLPAVRNELAQALKEAEAARTAAGAVRLCIGTPCFGGNVTDHYTMSLLGLQAACQRRGLSLSFCLLHGDALITRARNSVVAEFLRDTSATHLLFIDADIGFSPDQVFRLLEADRDMVGGAYPVKTVNWNRAAAGVPAAATFDYVVELLEPGAPPPADGFARARYVGTGFLLVRRAVFERMAARYPEIRYSRSHASADADIVPDGLHAYFDCVIDRDSGHYLSEDFTFCKRWLDMGGELWVDLHSRLSHIGRHVFAGDYGYRSY
ncbi:MAG: tetratricopeptide repeat protein [Rhodospirillaceae bacterium]